MVKQEFSLDTCLPGKMSVFGIGVSVCVGEAAIAGSKEQDRRSEVLVD